jgi:hypothetical protein
MKFIEKKYYTFTELETKWECTAGDLVQSVIDGELMPSVHMLSGTYLLHRFTPHNHEDADSDCFPSQLTDPSIDKVNNEVRRWLEGFYYLILPTRTSAWACVFRYFSDTPLSRDHGDLCFSLEQPVDIDYVLKSGVVMAEEVARFEAKGTDQSVASGTDRPLSTVEHNTPEASPATEIDPLDLPIELDAANVAYRVVQKGFGDQDATFKKRVVDYLQTNYPQMAPEALKRISTLVNPQKQAGRRKKVPK